MGKQIPFHLPSSIFENKWTKETHTEEMKLPSVKGTEGCLEGVSRAVEEPLEVPPQTGVWGGR